VGFDKGATSPYLLATLPIGYRGFSHSMARTKAAVLMATPSPTLKEPALLSVGELAARISPHATDQAAVISRIRHWTREGLLLPEGSRNPGTGRHRRYDELNVIDASVLNALAEQGINVVGREMAYALSRAREAARQWQARSKKDLQFFLELVSIRTPPSNYQHTAEVYEGKVPRLPTAEVAIVLNLGHLIARLQLPNLQGGS
jgi:DNA-binding transcriptional MerR regulator